ncbi:7631_t:CDS:2, partial [Paraglomus occultum]
EESFNLQATHDILEYGIWKESLYKYDHFSFPGVVPRTFIGPLLLGGAAYPIVAVSKWFNPSLQKLWIQYLVRIILGLSTVFAMSKLRGAIKRSFGQPISIGFMLLSMCQFHTIFWISRTLPNMFAFPL